MSAIHNPILRGFNPDPNIVRVNDDDYYIVTSTFEWFGGPWKDAHNYYVTADDITGNWSQAIYLNSSGFAPSIFHDEDGKSYLLNMLVDHRNSKFFAGIVIQQLDLKSRSLVGDIEYI